MSLHLIESRKSPAVATRKRGGAVASTLIHGMLVLSVFTIASASPVPHRHSDAPIHTNLLVTPTPPAVNRQTKSSPSTSSAPSTASVDHAPPLPNFSIDIPTTLPSIDATASEAPTTFGRPHSGGNNAIGTGDGLGSGDIHDVMDRLQVDRPVVALAGMRTPRYPESLRAAGVEDTVLATFVVDTLGRIESASVDITQASHAQFATAVREVLSSAKFRPAELGGHRVRQRVALPFVFSLSRN